MTEPKIEAAPKKSFLGAIKDALLTWLESPSGKHTMVAVAAGLGTLLEQIMKGYIHG